MPTLYYTAFASLVELILNVWHGAVSWATVWPSILTLLITTAVTVIAGRYFCGWMCAFGSLTDWVYKVFSPLANKNIRFTKKADDILKFVKFCVLIVLLGIGVLAATFSLSAMSPWDAFGMLFTVGEAPALVFVVQSLLPGLVLLIIILFASAFTERFFCRYLCPMGAFFSLTSGKKLFLIRKERTSCGNCKICTQNCTMGIPLNEMDEVTSGECIACLKCVEVCPRKNVHLYWKKESALPVIAVITAVCMTSAFLSVAAVMSERNNVTIPTATETVVPSDTSAAGIETQPSGTDTGSTTAPQETVLQTTTQMYADGVYRGIGTGFRGGTTKIDITILEGQITGVKDVSTQDDWEFFDKAFSRISNDIIASQSTQVDTVSHATYSSKGILEAARDALAKAKN
jgi:uncharacterized protein with FMN-binding domain